MIMTMVARGTTRAMRGMRPVEEDLWIVRCRQSECRSSSTCRQRSASRSSARRVHVADVAGNGRLRLSEALRPSLKPCLTRAEVLTRLQNERLRSFPGVKQRVGALVTLNVARLPSSQYIVKCRRDRLGSKSTHSLSDRLLDERPTSVVWVPRAGIGVHRWTGSRQRAKVMWTCRCRIHLRDGVNPCGRELSTTGMGQCARTLETFGFRQKAPRS